MFTEKSLRDNAYLVNAQILHWQQAKAANCGIDSIG